MDYYYTPQFKGYTQVEWPDRKSREEVLGFLRRSFGDNDIFLPLNRRRWVTQGASQHILFRNKEDVLWFKLVYN